MGEVRRFTPDTFGDGVVMVEVRTDERYETSDETEFCEARDVARLERERDELVSLRDTLTAELDRRFRRIAILESSVAKCQNNDAELTRLRAVEADYATLQGFMRDRMPALIAARLAADDGYDPEDQHGGLYDLRWTGGPTPEPEGDAWSMDYLPRGEKIAADLAEACGRKG